MQIKGLDSLMRKLNALGGDVQQALGEGTRQTAQIAKATAIGNAPASKYSQADSMGGASLKSSISAEDKEIPNGWEGRVFSNAPHAKYVEFGTGPVGAANHAGTSPHAFVTYTLRPMWAFPVILKGELTFRMTSGQPARPFMYQTAVQHKDTFEKVVKASLNRAIRGLAK